MKKKRMIILILQIFIILASVFMIMRYTNNKIKPIEVFVYTKAIDDVSVPITENDVKKVVVPTEAITKDFARSEKDIIGKYVDTRVSPGQYIYKSQLVEKEDIDIFETMDLSKYRKISMPISYVEAFAGNIKKGDTIDLMYIGQGSKEATDDEDSGGSFTYSKIFMQDVLVYSVNDAKGFEYADHSHRDATYDEEKEEISTEATESGDLAIITLAATLEQAEQIETRMNSGQIRFVGRFNDSESYNTLGYVLGDYGKVFSGQGFAETDNLLIEEDDFDIIELENNEKKGEKKEKEEKGEKANKE